MMICNDNSTQITKKKLFISSVAVATTQHEVKAIQTELFKALSPTDEQISENNERTAKQKFRQLKPPTIVTTFTSEITSHNTF